MGMALLVVSITFVLGVVIGLMPRLAAGPIEVTNATPPVIAGLVVAGLMDQAPVAPSLRSRW